jgi:hypothetical protein
MTVRSVSFVSGLVLLAAVVGAILLTPAAAAKRPKPPPPPPPPPAPSSFSTYVKNFASVVDGQKCDLTPETVRAASDGGSVLLAISGTPSALASYRCAGVNWVAKLDPYGNAQWQELVGCLAPPPGWYSFAVSLDRTAEGGYVLGGGVIGCGAEAICPGQCGLVEKLDATGRLVWARAYSSGAGDRESVINSIRQTADGGLVAAGTYRDPTSSNGAWIIRLDAGGNVQWQRKLGPAGDTDVYFNAVRPTADGGAVAAGEHSPPNSCQYPHGCGQSVFVAKFAANGDVAWQRVFNTFDSSGAPTASEHALAVTQTADGGYLVGGNWGNSATHGSCCRGALLLKLDTNGASQWQKAYSGGIACYAGINTTCTAIGPTVYSLQQTSDGGYALGGAGTLKLASSLPLVPWLAKTDASGNLVWQRFYYQEYPTTGSPISQYFASSDLAGSGGYLGLGFTVNPSDSIGELLAVKTDGDGLVGSCSQVHPATDVEVLDPGLVAIAPGLPVGTTGAVHVDAQSTTQPTSVSSTAGQC